MSEWLRQFSGLVVRATAGAVVGIALGFAIGWWLWPVEYTNTAPQALRQDYRDDYVVMVATAFQVERDLDQASQRLQMLSPTDPAAPVVELGERLVKADASAEDILYLARLADAMESLTPTLAPYLDVQP